MLSRRRTSLRLSDIQEFVTGARHSAADELERVLATVLFTDIVNSTRSAVEAGDHTWPRLLDSHDQLAATSSGKRPAACADWGGFLGIRKFDS
jgi:class 3 adenylate cyclase